MAGAVAAAVATVAAAVGTAAAAVHPGLPHPRSTPRRLVLWRECFQRWRKHMTQLKTIASATWTTPLFLRGLVRCIISQDHLAKPLELRMMCTTV